MKNIFPYAVISFPSSERMKNSEKKHASKQNYAHHGFFKHSVTMENTVQKLFLHFSLWQGCFSSFRDELTRAPEPSGIFFIH
jgi:hypothetical protein